MRNYATCLIAICIAAPALAAGPTVPFKLGNWFGGGYTNNQTGAFDHCAFGAKYQSGHMLNLSMMADGHWLLGLSHPSWTLAPGQAIPLDLTFDGRGPVRVFAQQRTEKQYIVVMPAEGAVIQAFSKVRLLQIFTNGRLLGFNINGQGAPLLAALVSCVRSQGASLSVPAPQAARVAPAPRSAPPRPSAPVNTEAKVERDKLIAQSGAEYGACLKTQMANIVPYSNESAETLSRVILTKCEEAENKFVSLGMALTNKSRAEVQAMLGKGLTRQKANIVAAIVSFRADSVKRQLQPKPPAPANKVSRDAI